VGSERNHKNRKTDNQKALKEPGLYKQICLPGLDDVDNKPGMLEKLYRLAPDRTILKIPMRIWGRRVSFQPIVFQSSYN